MKKSLPKILLMLLVTSCNVSPGNNSSFNTKSDIEPLASVKPNFDPALYKMPDEDISKIKPLTNNTDTKVPKHITFEDVPSSGENVPGSVSVIYWNTKKIRIDKKNTSITSLDSESSLLVNNIIKKYKIKSISDYAFPNVSEEEMDNTQKKSSEMSESEMPHAHSMQTYHFAEDADTKKISDELKKLPFVITAYPSQILKPMTAIVTSQPLAPAQKGSTEYHAPLLEVSLVILKDIGGGIIVTKFFMDEIYMDRLLCLILL